jgi:uncharacterized membrane protein
MNLQNSILVITITLTALIAGLFYSYACSVNLGLGKLSDSAYLSAMQSINKEIQNPTFFVSFMGTLLFLPISSWMEYSHSGFSNSFWLLVSAAIIYAIGTFGITIVLNVPLNEALDKFVIDSASLEQLAAQRKSFEIPWNRYNMIRTVTAVISLIIVIISCVIKPLKTVADHAV